MFISCNFMAKTSRVVFSLVHNNNNTNLCDIYVSFKFSFKIPTIII